MGKLYWDYAEFLPEKDLVLCDINNMRGHAHCTRDIGYVYIRTLVSTQQIIFRYKVIL